MAYSDDYLRQLDRRVLKNENVEKEPIRKLFFQYLPEVPEDLCWDIFNLFFEDEDAGKIGLQAKRLALVIDLVEGEYDEKTLELTDDELRYISEGVNDFALELSDEILMNVMKAAVYRGLLG